MNNVEKTLKVKMLKDILESDYNISSGAELKDALNNMQPIDISAFVVSPISDNVN